MDREPNRFSEHLRKRSGCLRKFSEAFMGIFGYEGSDSTNPDKSLKPLRLKKLAGIP